MSIPCPRCGTGLERVPRSSAERLIYRKVLACSACGYRMHERRVPFHSLAVFVFSRYTHCIECRNPRVRLLPRRDGIDRMSAHPLSLLFSLTLAPIYHCSPCRLQYHDWRRVDPAFQTEARSSLDTDQSLS